MYNCFIKKENNLSSTRPSPLRSCSLPENPFPEKEMRVQADELINKLPLSIGIINTTSYHDMKMKNIKY